MCGFAFEAFSSAWFTSACVVGFFVFTTKSTIETVGIGTLTARPFSFPFSSGITRPTDFAAPVDVGIKFAAAALALRRSLWPTSRILWSFV